MSWVVVEQHGRFRAVGRGGFRAALRRKLRAKLQVGRSTCRQFPNEVDAVGQPRTRNEGKTPHETRQPNI